MIKQATFDFLNDLKANNNRDWFKANKKQYDAAKDNIIAFLSELIPKIKVFDEGIGALQPKECLFRIYRDVRFSKNKAPYKTNFGASISPGGKKMMSAGYYINIATAGECFAGGGMYMPPSKLLKAIRQEIDYNSKTFEAILNAPDFKSTYGELQHLALKTAPKGYPKDHPYIHLLRYKSYVATKKFTEAEVLSTHFADEVAASFSVLKPLNDFLNEAIVDVNA